MTFKNLASQARTWLHLTHPETGRTLHLEPGEEVDLDLPADFKDPHLQPVKPTAAKKAAADPVPEAPAPTTPTTTEEH